MKKPSNLSQVPQGGWNCRFPDGFSVTAQHPADFLKQCFAHLEGNGGDTGTGWREYCWDLVCQTHPEIECIDTEAPAQRSIGPDDVRRFFTTMWEKWKGGEETVSEEVQNERVSTCLRCPHKGHVACFGGCSQLSQMLSEFVLGRTIRNLPEIHKVSCLACACLLEVKTAFPIEVLKRVDEKLGATPEYWDDANGKCWMLSEATQSTDAAPLQPATSASM